MLKYGYHERIAMQTIYDDAIHVLVLIGHSTQYQHIAVGRSEQIGCSTRHGYIPDGSERLPAIIHFYTIVSIPVPADEYLAAVQFNG